MNKLKNGLEEINHNSLMTTNKKGIVYVLTNPAMPKIVKIGLTTREGIEQRMKELFTTGVPVPFECAFACTVDDCEAVENALHIAFSPNRINPKREFFSIEPEQPIAILKLFKKQDVTLEVNKEIDSQTTETDKQAGEKLKKERRPPLNFSEMGISEGTILTFNDEDINAEVVVCSDKKVKYQNKEYSLTQLTKELFKLDYNIQPTRFWSFNGRSLNEIYNETYVDN
jgi:T5orf172 domain